MDIYHSRIPWLTALLAGLWFPPYWAVTFGQTTWWTVDETEIGPSWRRHEDCHKAQFARDGWLRFLTRYVGEYIAGVFRYLNLTDAYLQISYEVEGRRAGERIAPRLNLDVV